MFSWQSMTFKTAEGWILAGVDVGRNRRANRMLPSERNNTARERRKTRRKLPCLQDLQDYRMNGATG